VVYRRTLPAKKGCSGILALFRAEYSNHPTANAATIVNVIKTDMNFD
jgi:hypothetical protein